MESGGYVANYNRVWAWRPELVEGLRALWMQARQDTELRDRDFAVLVAATASELGDSYCSLAWGTKLAALADENVAAEVIVGGEGGDLTDRDVALARWARPERDECRRHRSSSEGGARRQGDRRGDGVRRVPPCVLDGERRARRSAGPQACRGSAGGRPSRCELRTASGVELARYFPSHVLTAFMCDFTYFSAAFAGGMCLPAIQLETRF